MIVERRIGLGAEPLELLRVGEHASLGGELFVFTSTKPRPLELAHLEVQQIQSCGLLTLADFQRVELSLQETPFAKYARHPIAIDGEPCKIVQQPEMTLGIEQRLVLMLTMQLHQSSCVVLERRRCNQRVVDERAASTL